MYVLFNAINRQLDAHVFLQRQKKKAISLMDEIWQNLIFPIPILLVFWGNFDFLLNEEKNCSREKRIVFFCG